MFMRVSLRPGRTYTHGGRTVVEDRFFLIENLIPNLVLKVSNYSSGTSFLINKDKNRFKLFLTFYLPSTSMGVAKGVSFQLLGRTFRVKLAARLEISV